MRSWVMADASATGVVRLAVYDERSRSMRAQATLAADAHPIFTDALLHYLRSNSLEIRDLGCVLAVGGPPVADSIRIARSRWTISRLGLKSLFGGGAAILNDVVALAWSALDPGASLVSLTTGAKRPQTTIPGRWAVIVLDEGIGAAIMDISDGGVSMSATEIGHIGFSPPDEHSWGVMAKLRRQHAHVSWERVLTSQEGREDEHVRRHWLRLAAHFVGDVQLATGSWSGVLLCGKKAAPLKDALVASDFARDASGKSAFGRQLAASSMLLMPTRDPLLGCRLFIEQHLIRAR